MPTLPPSVADFLSGKPIVVTGVSRQAQAAANAIFRRLRDTGNEPIPVNPNASEVEGARCWPSVSAVPGEVHAVLVASHPSTGAGIVREAAARGVKRVWFHRSFGAGSVGEDALAACRETGIEPIVGGCPLMYAGKVDGAHGFIRALLRLFRRVPG